MTSPWHPDRGNTLFIRTPIDMPLKQIAMLQTTIHEAWAAYDGDPHNAEQFWNFLVGNGVADVPRETSPPTSAHDALLEFLRNDPQPSREEWEAHMQEIERRAELLNDVDVPRETSEGES